MGQSVISERDEIVKVALEQIISLYLEGFIYNADHLGYWKLFNTHVIEISTYSFRAGLTDFYSSLEAHPDAKELIAYHLRIFTRLANTETVRSAAVSLYETFKDNWNDYRVTQTNFDLLQDDQIIELSIFNKIIFLIHIYYDIISISLTIEKEKQAPQKNKSHKFRVQ